MHRHLNILNCHCSVGETGRLTAVASLLVILGISVARTTSVPVVVATVNPLAVRQQVFLRREQCFHQILSNRFVPDVQICHRAWEVTIFVGIRSSTQVCLRRQGELFEGLLQFGRFRPKRGCARFGICTERKRGVSSQLEAAHTLGMKPMDTHIQCA